MIVAFSVWYFVFTGEQGIPVGVVVPNILAAPMSRTEAEGYMRRVRETGTIEARGGDVAVTFPAASWPERRDGQLALAQQVARADEIIEGRKRTIAFYDPAGKLYARAEAAGVMLVR